LRETIAAAGLSPADAVLEVGAGIGTLTLALAAEAGWVTAVEVDRALVPALRAVLAQSPNVRVVEGDILRLAPAALFSGPAGAPRKVVANLPYNVGSAVLMRLLETVPGLGKVVVTVQREVAERLCARPGRKAYGLLSVAVQYRAVPRIVARIPPGAFYPPPAVESALVEIVPRARPAAAVADERRFFRLAAAAFGQRRKTLPNAVAAGLGLPRDTIAAACRAAGVDPGARAEALDLDAFARLSEALAAEWRGP
jgi:16S rRNA (adenine1518-N6/adenine1519-N6)-dimethyltransferase